MKKRLNNAMIAKRIAQELQSGDVVNLGIGIGTMVANFVPPGKDVTLHSENGVIGYGHVLSKDEADLMDYNLINAGTQFVAPLPGMSIVDMADAFDAIRNGRVDITVLGALQVSEKGDLANWTTDVKGTVGTIGGAMDMPVGAKKIIIAMEHTTKDNQPKILKECTLPLTAPQCVDLIVTDLAVIEVTPEGLVLKEVASDWTAEEVQSLTEPRLFIPEPVKTMPV
ncbi:MAG: 3-oxoacid CoA-transferase subunit B [Pseudomonadota bacterium]